MRSCKARSRDGSVSKYDLGASIGLIPGWSDMVYGELVWSHPACTSVVDINEVCLRRDARGLVVKS